MSQSKPISVFHIAEHKHTLNIAVILLIPVILLLNNESWLYTDVGWTDPWSYLSHFLHYDTANEFFDYKVARAPWIWSGFAAYRLFSPETATVVLCLSYFYLALFSFYFILARLFSARAAFVTTVLLACYMEFHSPYGWLYHNMVSTAFYLLSLLLFIHATEAEKRQNAWLFSSGAVLFLTICTSLVYLPLVIIPIIFFLVICYQDSDLSGSQIVRSAGKALFWIASGGVITAALLTFINGSITGNFWLEDGYLYQFLGLDHDVVKLPLFLRQFQYALDYHEYEYNRVIEGANKVSPFINTLKGSAYLVIPSLVFIISACRLGWLGRGMVKSLSENRRSIEDRKDLHEILAYTQHIFLYAVFYYLHRRGSPIFWISAAAFPLVGTSFLSIGSFLSRFGGGMRLFTYPQLRLIVFILVPLPLLIIFHLIFLEKYALHGWQVFLLPFILCAVTFSSLLYKKHAQFILILFLAGLTSVNVLVANRPYLVRPYIYDKCYPRKELFLASFDGIKYLDRSDIIHANMAYIYDYNDEFSVNIDVCERHKYHHIISEIAVSVSVARNGWGKKRNLVENNYVYSPGQPKDMTTFIRQLPASKKIAVISSLHSSGDRLSRLRAAADSLGRTITEISRQTIRRGNIAYEIVVLSAP
jgi:hypothetical protein